MDLLSRLSHYVRTKNVWLVVYVLLFIVYSIWTYSLTDPNLVLTSWQPYLNFQNWIWSLNKHLVTQIYAGLIFLLFIIYSLILKSSRIKVPSSKNPQFTIHNPLLLFVLCLVPLLFSYNALSHDVFNYIFNARMVLKYGADPHVQTALQFAQDDWTRFMHNVHTPAPYFYGWTGLSLIPYVAGFGKFLSTWLVFRAWSALGLLLLVFAQFKLAEALKLGDKAKLWVMAFALNPLVLIEIISNSHNDAWMMGAGLGSLLMVSQMANDKWQIANWWKICLSLVLLLFSISIKYATVLLIPIWLFLVTFNFHPHIIDGSISKKYKELTTFIRPFIFDLAALLLFTLLLTTRSQQFHPWYLIWPLSFIPFMKLSWWRNVLLVLSISSLFRYVPWMWNGGFEFTDQIQLRQKMITWIPVIIFMILYSFRYSRKKL